MIAWYAVALDVAGGVAEWSGPHRWASARRLAVEWERSEYVWKVLVCESMPFVNKRYLDSERGRALQSTAL